VEVVDRNARKRLQENLWRLAVMSDKNLIEIDGSFGEGGGQILRTTLALSMIGQNPVRISNIRAGRAKPGLRRQHLCAVNAAREICDATLTGDCLGSSEIQFWPQPIRKGNFSFQIGTAGSCTLVAQTVLIPLLVNNQAATVQITGGTHNPMCPPFDFFAKTLLPLVRHMGFDISSELKQYGFYPKGGGKIEVNIRPRTLDSLQPINLTERGKLRQFRCTAIVANLPNHIAEREIKTLKRKSGWHKATYDILEISEPKFGNANLVVVEMDYENVTEVIIEIGRQGVPAESVASKAIKKANAFAESNVPVGEYLCDQLLLPAAIVATETGLTSRFLTGALSQHSLTHIDLLQRLLPVKILVDDSTADQLLVQISSNHS